MNAASVNQVNTGPISQSAEAGTSIGTATTSTAPVSSTVTADPSGVNTKTETSLSPVAVAVPVASEANTHNSTENQQATKPTSHATPNGECRSLATEAEATPTVPSKENGSVVQSIPSETKENDVQSRTASVTPSLPPPAPPAVVTSSSPTAPATTNTTTTNTNTSTSTNTRTMMTTTMTNITNDNNNDSPGGKEETQIEPEQEQAKVQDVVEASRSADAAPVSGTQQPSASSANSSINAALVSVVDNKPSRAEVEQANSADATSMTTTTPPLEGSTPSVQASPSPEVKAEESNKENVKEKAETETSKEKQKPKNSENVKEKEQEKEKEKGKDKDKEKEKEKGEKSDDTTCQNCQTSTTPLWRRDENGQVLCNACGLFLKLHGRRRPISLKTDVIKPRNRSRHNPSMKRAKNFTCPSPSSSPSFSPLRHPVLLQDNGAIEALPMAPVPVRGNGGPPTGASAGGPPGASPALVAQVHVSRQQQLPLHHVAHPHSHPGIKSPGLGPHSHPHQHSHPHGHALPHGLNSHTVPPTPVSATQSVPPPPPGSIHRSAGPSAQQGQVHSFPSTPSTVFYGSPALGPHSHQHQHQHQQQSLSHAPSPHVLPMVPSPRYASVPASVAHSPHASSANQNAHLPHVSHSFLLPPPRAGPHQQQQHSNGVHPPSTPPLHPQGQQRHGQQHQLIPGQVQAQQTPLNMAQHQQQQQHMMAHNSVAGSPILNGSLGQSSQSHSPALQPLSSNSFTKPIHSILNGHASAHPAFQHHPGAPQLHHGMPVEAVAASTPTGGPNLVPQRSSARTAPRPGQQQQQQQQQPPPPGPSSSNLQRRIPSPSGLAIQMGGQGQPDPRSPHIPTPQSRPLSPVPALAPLKNEMTMATNPGLATAPILTGPSSVHHQNANPPMMVTRNSAPADELPVTGARHQSGNGHRGQMPLTHGSPSNGPIVLPNGTSMSTAMSDVKPNSRPASPLSRSTTSSTSMKANDSRVAELELVNDLLRSRVAQLEASESRIRDSEMLLRRENEVLKRRLDEMLSQPAMPSAGVDSKSAPLHPYSSSPSKGNYSPESGDSDRCVKRIRVSELV